MAGAVFKAAAVSEQAVGRPSGLNPVSELRYGVCVNFWDSGGEAGAGIFRSGYGQASQVSSRDFIRPATYSLQ